MTKHYTAPFNYNRPLNPGWEHTLRCVSFFCQFQLLGIPPQTTWSHYSVPLPPIFSNKLPLTKLEELKAQLQFILEIGLITLSQQIEKNVFHSHTKLYITTQTPVANCLKAAPVNISWDCDKIVTFQSQVSAGLLEGYGFSELSSWSTVLINFEFIFSLLDIKSHICHRYYSLMTHSYVSSFSLSR